MRVERFLQDTALRFPDKTGLIAGGRRMSYAELDAESDGIAVLLAQRGLARGDRAIVFMDNCWEAVVGIFGVIKAGGVFSPVNPSTKADKLAYVINNCRAKAIFTQGKLMPVVEAVQAECQSLKIIVSPERDYDFAIDVKAAPPSLPGIDIDLCMLVYTSGSTGLPKGVMMTHQNVVAAAASITTYLEIAPNDIILNVLPISFDYGLYQVLMAVKVGATLVLEKSFAFPHAIFNCMKEEQVTGLPLVPTMAALILQMRDLKPGDFPRLRYITNTAAALPSAHIMRLQELFPTTHIYSMYGLTECKRCTYLPPSELDKRPSSVGIAIPGTEAFVVDDSGARVKPGETGELVIRGAHVMKGYWENPEETDKALRPGPFPWEKVLHTGDLFRTDDDGFLYFVGRKDDIIKSRGEKVSPKEVENVLYALPGIREAAVIGTPDPILGMAIKAVVALAPEADLTEQNILRHCAKHLEDFMVPKIVEFRDELPKTESGKISRRLVGFFEAAE